MTEETFAPIFSGTNTGLLNAFEYWLQGRVNLCVTGLQDQITRLEIQNTELRKELSKLENGEMRDMSLRFKEFFDQEMESYWQTHAHPLFDYENMLDNMKGFTAWNEAVAEVYGTKAFEDAVDDAFGGSALEDKIKGIVENLEFRVSVS